MCPLFSPLSLRGRGKQRTPPLGVGSLTEEEPRLLIVEMAFQAFYILLASKQVPLLGLVSDKSQQFISPAAPRAIHQRQEIDRAEAASPLARRVCVVGSQAPGPNTEIRCRSLGAFRRHLGASST